MPQIPQLQSLISAVEKRFRETVRTSTGFDRLAAAIEKDTGETLGASTLKRIWGYVTGVRTPRLSTLDILAKYAGYPDFKQFCANVMDQDGSDYVSERTCITSDDLRPGNSLLIGWAPDRQVTLSYLGNDLFRVTESVNSKLRPGDVMEASCFLAGWPLYFPYILRDGTKTPPYIAGKAHGLTILRKQ